jgi:hypothetical protein
MKKRIIIYLLIISSIVFYSCNINFPYEDFTPPSPPKNITVLNGDQRVDLYWKQNPENDIAGYNIYYSYSYNGKYTLIGSSGTNSFVDYGITNGVKYYYAVTAYDYNGNESELSYDVIYAVPRPEGFNQSIFDIRRFPNNSGYSFSKYSVVPYNSLDADFFFENYQGTYYLVVYDDTDIKDMGPTMDIYDIQFAPNSGWSTSKDEIAKVGNTYVIWTWNNRYAKIRIKNITPDRIVFDWAYQTVEGEPMLKPNKERNKLSLNRKLNETKEMD